MLLDWLLAEYDSYFIVSISATKKCYCTVDFVLFLGYLLTGDSGLLNKGKFCLM